MQPFQLSRLTTSPKRYTATSIMNTQSDRDLNRFSVAYYYYLPERSAAEHRHAFLAKELGASA